MAVTITHVFLWGSSATNHIENALMGSPCLKLAEKRVIFICAIVHVVNLTARAKFDK
jgi:hypothetical protein